MTFALTIDADAWHAHQDLVSDSIRRITGEFVVPVIKGNGYGIGQGRLAREAVRLGVDAVAVGTVYEVDEVAHHGNYDIVVLEPFDPRDAMAAEAWWQMGSKLHSGRVIRTVSSREALMSLTQGDGSVRVLLEAQTSMHRFGFDEDEMLRLLADSAVREALARGRVLIDGLSLHMPIAQPADDIAPRGVTAGSAKVREVVRWAGLWQAETAVWAGHNSPASRVWVSHLDDNELSAVVSSVDEVRIRVRVGTALWHGKRSSLQASGTVLAVYPLGEGVHVGYRQRTGPKDGTLVIVSGGTTHGIGLSAPSPATSLRQRAISASTGALDAAGRALSPFSWAGKQRWFAESPHAQVSMLWLPKGCLIPAVGDRMGADVRLSTSHFDVVRGLD